MPFTVVLLPASLRKVVLQVRYDGHIVRSVDEPVSRRQALRVKAFIDAHADDAVAVGSVLNPLPEGSLARDQRAAFLSVVLTEVL